ncbi:hypothetical protein D3C71_76830 [compost metagenome]
MINKFIKSNYLKSIQWGMVSMVITFLNQLVLIPIFLSIFSKEIFGIWIILSSMILLIRAINLGQLNYSSNLINLGNVHEIEDHNNILKVGFNSNIIMSVIQIITLIIISIPEIFNFFTDIPLDIIKSERLSSCLIIFGLSKIIYQLYNLYVLRIYEAFDKINKTIKYQGLGEALEFLSLTISCFIFKDIFYMCLVSFATSLLYCIYIHKLVVKDKIKYYFRINIFSLKKGLNHIKKSFYLTISFLVEKFTESGLNIIVSFFYSLSFLPLFSTTRTITNAAIKISNIIAVPLMPQMQKNFSKNNYNQIYISFEKYWRISLIIIIIGFTILLPFIEDIYNIWTKNKINFNKNLFLLIICAVSLQNFNVVLLEYLKKINLTKKLLFINLSKVICVIIVLSIFGYYNEVLGIGFSLIIAELITTIFIYLLIKINFSFIFNNFLYNILFILSLLFYYETNEFLVFCGSNILIVLIYLRKRNQYVV